MKGRLKAAPTKTLRERSHGRDQLPPLCDGFSSKSPGPALPARSTASGRMLSSEASVGPYSPRGNRLGPDRRNTLSGDVLRSNRTPMKQLLISSQFCGPHTTFVSGSGLKRLAFELSKWLIKRSLDPFDSEIDSAY